MAEDRPLIRVYDAVHILRFVATERPMNIHRKRRDPADDILLHALCDALDALRTALDAANAVPDQKRAAAVNDVMRRTVQIIDTFHEK
jgi:2C-methyl-D-erythritol 2,4-cyclodiphosphate synthase